MSIARFRLEIKGRVQGVGFRPTVYRYARERDLEGWVSNGPEGVTIDAQGESERLVEFVSCVRRGLPPNSSIRSFDVFPLAISSLPRPFQISKTRSRRSAPSALVPPDLAICEKCREEMFDSTDRRYLYPFINCTNCGPRFSIVTALPYDRPATTMRKFEMCPKCRAEYENPADRRFHAQPNACPVCGPQAAWMDSRGTERLTGADALRRTARQIISGQIVALQSIGGFHLACDARNEDAVNTLRLRKHRPHKPFAVMVEDMTAARSVALISSRTEKWMCRPEAPIVIADSKLGMREWLAPGLGKIGIMIAPTPLHLAIFHFLRKIFRGTNVLVMTSGNLAGEPICVDMNEAQKKLSGIADGFLSHDRPIHNRCDDSVIAVRGSRFGAVRRARGFAPVPERLPNSGPGIFAAGADLKSAACVTREDEAFLTQYIGDLSSLPTEIFYREAVEHLAEFLDVRPAFVVHDAHPDMLSRRIAEALAEKWEIPRESRLAVQHHHAHIAATLAEYNSREPAVGVAFDGAGYGWDGTVWGGEFFVVAGTDCRRIGHLLQVTQPGGDRAAVEIWRMALSWLIASLGVRRAVDAASRIFPEVDPRQIVQVAHLCDRPAVSPVTSSVGRLFDAAAALAGVRTEVTYEGQAAMELEALYDECAEGEYEFRLRRRASLWILDPRPAIRRLLSDRMSDTPASIIASRFHHGLATASTMLCKRISAETGLRNIALGGGVFQNMILADLFERNLMDADIELLAPERIPANDGGIALGQAWIGRIHQSETMRGGG